MNWTRERGPCNRFRPAVPSADLCGRAGGSVRRHIPLDLACSPAVLSCPKGGPGSSEQIRLARLGLNEIKDARAGESGWEAGT